MLTKKDLVARYARYGKVTVETIRSRLNDSGFRGSDEAYDEEEIEFILDPAMERIANKEMPVSELPQWAKARREEWETMKEAQYALDSAGTALFQDAVNQTIGRHIDEVVEGAIEWGAERMADKVYSSEFVNRLMLRAGQKASERLLTKIKAERASTGLPGTSDDGAIDTVAIPIPDDEGQRG